MRADSTPQSVEVERRFWNRVHKGDVCWNWTGFLSNGYGRFDVGDFGTRVAHRIAYELLVGPIPDGLVIDHLCRNTRCVNPDHLEPVTERENILRGFGPTAMNARKTHCDHGHEFTAENTYEQADRPGQRLCRECHRIKRRTKRRQNHAEKMARFEDGGVVWDDLSDAQRYHLGELGEIAERGQGEAHWGPMNAGERACARALERRGLLVRNIERGRLAYSLTKLGLSVVREGDRQETKGENDGRD